MTSEFLTRPFPTVVGCQTTKLYRLMTPYLSQIGH